MKGPYALWQRVVDRHTSFATLRSARCGKTRTLGMCSDRTGRSVQETVDFLVRLDPAFETELEVEEPEELNHHLVMRRFASYFAANHNAFSARKLRSLGEWLNAAVAAGGNLENAVSTCFLEHSRQLKVNRVLAPYLSQQAKRASRA